MIRMIPVLALAVALPCGAQDAKSWLEAQGLQALDPKTAAGLGVRVPRRTGSQDHKARVGHLANHPRGGRDAVHQRQEAGLGRQPSGAHACRGGCETGHEGEVCRRAGPAAVYAIVSRMPWTSCSVVSGLMKQKRATVSASGPWPTVVGVTSA